MLIMEALLAGHLRELFILRLRIQINFLSLKRAKKLLVMMRQKPSPSSMGIGFSIISLHHNEQSTPMHSGFK
jgi:hypothetical protein